jgi:DNA repair protein RecO (recombination protein O)
MQWQDEGIVLALRPHGEGSAVAEIFTRAHGRHLGLVRGARREGAMLQPGNSVVATWRGRLSEHLGFYRFEPLRVRTGAIIDDVAALAALRAVTAVTAAVLPEREPHPVLYATLLAFLDCLSEDPAWPAALVRYELTLLEELGFGLDLSSGALTGARENLAYVSVETGRAVSAEAGAAQTRARLPLPAFLLSDAAPASAGDIEQGLALTAHFLERYLFRPHGKTLPAARLTLADVLARAKMAAKENHAGS